MSASKGEANGVSRGMIRQGMELIKGSLNLSPIDSTFKF